MMENRAVLKIGGSYYFNLPPEFVKTHRIKLGDRVPITADHLLEVTYPCALCGKAIELKAEKERQAIATYMREHGWGHSACHERNW